MGTLLFPLQDWKRLKGSIWQGGSDSYLFSFSLFNNLQNPGSSSSLSSLQPNPLSLLGPDLPSPAHFCLPSYLWPSFPWASENAPWQMQTSLLCPCSGTVDWLDPRQTSNCQPCLPQSTRPAMFLTECLSTCRLKALPARPMGAVRIGREKEVEKAPPVTLFLPTGGDRTPGLDQVRSPASHSWHRTRAQTLPDKIFRKRK